MSERDRIKAETSILRAIDRRHDNRREPKAERGTVLQRVVRDAADMMEATSQDRDILLQRIIHGLLSCLDDEYVATLDIDTIVSHVELVYHVAFASLESRRGWGFEQYQIRRALEVAVRLPDFEFERLYPRRYRKEQEHDLDSHD